eukprot:4314619-Amphidinium_carterae.1
MSKQCLVLLKVVTKQQNYNAQSKRLLVLFGFGEGLTGHFAFISDDDDDFTFVLNSTRRRLQALPLSFGYSPGFGLTRLRLTAPMEPLEWASVQWQRWHGLFGHFRLAELHRTVHTQYM